MDRLVVSQKTFFDAVRELKNFKTPQNVSLGHQNTLAIEYMNDTLSLTLVNDRFQVRKTFSNADFIVTDDNVDDIHRTISLDSLAMFEKQIHSLTSSDYLTLEFNVRELTIRKANIQIDYTYTSEQIINDNLNVKLDKHAVILGNELFNALNAIDFTVDRENGSVGGAIFDTSKLTLSGYSGNKLGTYSMKSWLTSLRDEHKPPIIINQKDISKLLKFTRAHKDSLINIYLNDDNTVLTFVEGSSMMISVSVRELENNMLMNFIDNQDTLREQGELHIINYDMLLSQLPTMNSKLLIINNDFLENVGSSTTKPVALSVDLKTFKAMLDNSVNMLSIRMWIARNSSQNVLIISNQKVTYLLTETKRVQ